MSDYISKEQAVNRAFDAEHKAIEAGDVRGANALHEMAMRLNDLPAADVAPVRHGEWVEFDGEGTYQCTFCGEPFILMNGTPRDNDYNYCPKCGAELDFKEADHD
jgi:DNA-directed RNA polymerase subunit RPC12/RpoP